jgi:flagellar biosynthesis/type III secretory pathway M-ring protein FliF/YscJ
MTWIWLSVVLYLVAFLIALLLVVPAMRRAATKLEGSDSATPSGGYGMIAGGSGFVSLLLLAVVVLMVWKP